MIQIAVHETNWAFYPVSVFIIVLFLSGCDNKQRNMFTITVMSYNVGNYSNPQPATARIAALIRNHGVPDLLFIQDMPWAMKVKELADLTGLPHFVAGPALSPYSHLGILSRFPLSNPDALGFQGTTERPAAICARTTLAGRHVLLCTLHLQSPGEEVRSPQKNDGLKLVKYYRVVWNELFRETLRTRSVHQFLTWVESKTTDIVILGGDFNSFQWSKPIRAMSATYEDAFWPALNYFRGTFKDAIFPLRLRLDYIFHSRNAICINTQVITDTAGDHFPIRATIGIPSSGRTNFQ